MQLQEVPGGKISTSSPSKIGLLKFHLCHDESFYRTLWQVGLDAEEMTVKLNAITTALILGLWSCSKISVQVADPEPISLPFLKNSANECYYLDEFMPIPTEMVTGRTGSMDLRYYNYKLANYKEWQLTGIMLKFYSRNGRCWSLFEEYYIAE